MTQTYHADPRFVGLLRAMADAPTDAGPALQAADLLAEYGETEREQYVRLECGWQDAPPSEAVSMHTTGLMLQVLYGPLWLGFDRGTQVTATWDRGFARSVRGPLAAFWEDRECGKCKGSGGRVNPTGGYLEFSGPQPSWERCPACSGTGRVSGPTAALVELVRREPLPLDGLSVTDYTPVGYAWGNAARMPGLARGDHAGLMLPGPIWDRLPGHGRETHYKCFPTESAANAALSRVLVAAARDRAREGVTA